MNVLRDPDSRVEDGMAAALRPGAGDVVCPISKPRKLIGSFMKLADAKRLRTWPILKYDELLVFVC
jgi:hypothetical protein